MPANLALALAQFQFCFQMTPLLITRSRRYGKELRFPGIYVEDTPNFGVKIEHNGVLKTALTPPWC